MKAQVLY